MDEESNVEEILDKHFLLFMSLTKTFYNRLATERDRQLSSEWLTKLCAEKADGISQKRQRNMLLSQLLMVMQEGKITGMFLSIPCDKTSLLTKALYTPQKYDDNLLGQLEDNIGETVDFQERSEDGRTYIAFRNLPKNQGTYAFVALTTDKDKGGDSITPSRSASKFELDYIKTPQKSSAGLALDSHSEMQIGNICAENIGDTTNQLYESLYLLKQKTKNKDMLDPPFYNMLLKQIDDEIRGNRDMVNSTIMFLIDRLAGDLKKEPKMKYLFNLTPTKLKLKLLEILRQKVVVRQQDEKRENLFTEMGQHILSSTTQPVSCKNQSREPDESMWQLTVTKPLAQSDVHNLYQIYPETAVCTFLNLLAQDRYTILESGRNRQNYMIDNITVEVYKEVQFGNAKYNKARAQYREWHEILSIVEEIMYEAGGKTVDQNTTSLPQEAILTNMTTSIKEIENLVRAETQRGELLAEKIINANAYTMHTEQDNDKNISWETKSAIDCLGDEIKTYKIIIAKQKQRIQELRKTLPYT